MTNQALINAHQLPSSRNIDEQDQVNALAAQITLSQSQLKNIESPSRWLPQYPNHFSIYRFWRQYDF